MEKKEISRREFLKSSGMIAGTMVMGSLLGGCATAGKGTVNGAAERKSTWDSKPPSVTDKVTGSRNYDVVIVGGGNGGVVCALELAQRGAKVVIVEQSGSCTMWAGDIDALDSKIQKAKGIAIDKEWVIHDLVRYGQGKVDENLIRQWAYNAGAFVDWYQEQLQTKGLDVMVDTVSKKFYPEGIYYSPDSVHTAFKPPLKATANSMGSEVAVPAMLELYAEAGGEILYHTKGVELCQEASGRVTGIIVQNQDGSYTRFNCSKAVVLATGGFSGNKTMMDELGVMSHKFCSNHIGGDGRNGDGIKLATWAGADRDYCMEGTCNIFDRGCITTDPSNGDIGLNGQGGTNPNFWWPGSQPFLRVNQFGKRFCNEDGPYDIVFNQACMQPGHFWWQVFDSSSWDDVVSFGTTICSRVVAAEGAKNCLLLGQFYPVTNAQEWDQIYIQPNVANGNLIVANTLEELADKMGIPKNNFLATVERYNQISSSGVDTDYGKAPWRLSNIDKTPYYAVKLAGWLLSTMAGIRVDTSYTPLKPDGSRIEGLKCIGLDHGGFFNGMYAQYYGGLNMSHVVVSAWLSAKDLMGAPYPVPVPSARLAYKS